MSKARISVIEFDVITIHDDDEGRDKYYGLLYLGGNLLFKHDVSGFMRSSYSDRYDDAEEETLRVFSEKLSKLLETV